MAGRGGSETQSRAATAVRQRTRNGRVSTRMPMSGGVTREQLPAIRPETSTGSGGSGNRPPTTPRNAAIPSGGTPRQIPIQLPTRTPALTGPSAASRAATATMAGAGRMIGGVGPALVIPNRGLEDGAEYERMGLAGANRRDAVEDPMTPQNMPRANPQPQPQATPQRRPQAQPQRESMTADRLNELSLAMVQGRDPNPQNTAETIAVERMKQMMSQSEMARGGTAMKPRMPSVKPPKSPKMPNVKKPTVPQMPRMAKGGMAKKGKC